VHGRRLDAREEGVRSLAQNSKRYKLAHTFLWGYSCGWLELAQLLGQLGAFLTSPLLVV
jgi:hypothetical protein